MRRVLVRELLPDGSFCDVIGYLREVGERYLLIAPGESSKRFAGAQIAVSRVVGLIDLELPDVELLKPVDVKKVVKGVPIQAEDDEPVKVKKKRKYKKRVRKFDPEILVKDNGVSGPAATLSDPVDPNPDFKVT
jgi:RNase H-fold protein (predicted Holliday junction resolvase)